MRYTTTMPMMCPRFFRSCVEDLARRASLLKAHSPVHILPVTVRANCVLSLFLLYLHTRKTMQSPGSKRRAKKEMIMNFFSKENVEKRKMEKLRKLQSEGAEFLSEAKVREATAAEKQIERKTEGEESSAETAGSPAFQDNDKESHERDSVFYYHNPMLALGLIEMQVQNVLRSHTLETEVIEEPELDKKPEDPNSPLKRVKLPKSKDYDQLRDGSKDDEPPLYFLELQSETKYRNGLGLETFHAKKRLRITERGDVEKVFSAGDSPKSVLTGSLYETTWFHLIRLLENSVA